MRILIAGVSTRAAAESAIFNGHEIITLDYYGDADQRSQVKNYSLMRDFDWPFSAQNLLRASRRLDYDALIYTSNLENHPGVVETLARGRMLLGNSPDTLRLVRDWRVLRAFCDRAGILYPATILSDDQPGHSLGHRWLRKPLHSGGGRGIRDRKPEERLDKRHLWQAFVDGIPASAAFVADGQRCRFLGLTEQLIGSSALNGQGFLWCGNLLPLQLPPGQQEGVTSTVDYIASQLTQRFGLVGLNGIDLILASSALGILQPYLIEVNPRWTASIELFEQAYGLNAFKLHMDGLAGRLPAPTNAEHLDGRYVGKAIVYADHNATAPDTAHWRTLGRRDIPHPVDFITAGQPICTVLAEGRNRQGCWNQLLKQARAVLREVKESGGLP